MRSYLPSPIHWLNQCPPSSIVLVVFPQKLSLEILGDQTDIISIISFFFLFSKAPIISRYLIMLKYHLPRKPEDPVTTSKKQILAMAKPTFCLFLQLDTITFSSVPSEICCFYHHLHPVKELKFKYLRTVIASSCFPHLIKAKQTGSPSLAPLGIQRFKISPHCQKM